jgi:endonuclease-3
MKPADIKAFFAVLALANPKPRSELEFSNNFELLTAVLLSAKATDVSVNKATQKLFLVANTPQTMLALGLEGLQSYVKSIGLYQTKSRHLLQTCQILLEQHDGQIPHTRQALEALPGVGRKTANVVLNVAFGEPVIGVDTHIFRISNRTGLASGKTPMAVEKQLQERIPQEYLSHAHHWLVLHGRHVCQARRPNCKTCSVANYCTFPNKILDSKLP